jgi:hypothetical protein
MFDANRRIAASVYIILMLGTLMCVRHCGARALVDAFCATLTCRRRHSYTLASTTPVTILVFALVIAQFLALIWSVQFCTRLSFVSPRAYIMFVDVRVPRAWLCRLR